jgi:hypothetical protein
MSNTDTEKQGCRICLEPIYHELRCRLAKGLNSPVLDSERKDFGRMAEATAESLEREHVDFVFDGMDCCAVCGLVKPHDGWKKPCKGAAKLSLRESNTNVPERVCPDCGAPMERHEPRCGGKKIGPNDLPRICRAPLSGGGEVERAEHVFDNTGRCVYCDFSPSSPVEDETHERMKCRLCHRGANEIKGFLHRVNEKGVIGIWECRPACVTGISNEDAIMMAVTGEHDVSDEPEALHEFRPAFGDQDYCCHEVGFEMCGLPADAPVHKESEPSLA